MEEQEKKEIESYITGVVKELKGIEREVRLLLEKCIGCGDVERNKIRRTEVDPLRSKANDLILGLASLIESKGYRPDGIYDEIAHLLKDAVPEWYIRNILSPP